MATARDGLLPESLARTNKHDVPANGLLISGVLVTALVLVDRQGELVDVFNVIILLGTMTGVVPYAFCTAALLQQLAVQPGISPPASGAAWWPSACSVSPTRSGRSTARASRRSSGVPRAHGRHPALHLAPVAQPGARGGPGLAPLSPVQAASNCHGVSCITEVAFDFHRTLDIVAGFKT